MTRRAILAGGLWALGGAALAEAPLSALRPRARAGSRVVTDLRPRARETLADIVASARLGGGTSVVVADARTGAILESVNANDFRPPASVTKVCTALYARTVLGPDHRFVTRVLATGPVTDGRLEGDLVLAGGGDPLLSTDDLAELAAALKAAGVTEVAGRFRVSTGGQPEFREVDHGQLAHVGYNPGVSGLNLNFNRVHFQWTQEGGDYRVTMDARSEALRPEVAVARMRVVDRRTPVYTYEDSDGVDAWTVARGALGTGGSRWLPVRRPALYAADVFRTLARAQGIALDEAVVEDAAPEGAEEIARHESPDLDEIVRGMLLYSTNLTAETLGLAATRARGFPTDSLAESAARMSRWLRAEHGIASRFVDHSGLGEASRISADEMVRLLLSVGPESDLRRLMKRIVLHDAQGEALDPSPALVTAKTGTLNFVSALSGYARTFGGSDLVFAIFSANLEERAEAKDLEEERPPGAVGWNGRAKWMQQRMLQRWGGLYSA